MSELNPGRHWEVHADLVPFQPFPHEAASPRPTLTFAGPLPPLRGSPWACCPALRDDRETQANPGISLTPHAMRNTDQGPLSPGPCTGPQYTERRRLRGGLETPEVVPQSGRVWLQTLGHLLPWDGAVGQRG